MMASETVAALQLLLWSPTTLWGISEGIMLVRLSM